MKVERLGRDKKKISVYPEEVLKTKATKKVEKTETKTAEKKETAKKPAAKKTTTKKETVKA